MVHRDHAAGRGPGVGRRAAARPGRASATAGTGSGTRADLAAHRDRLRQVIVPVVERAGYDLEELAVSRAGRRHVLRITVDGDRGVSLDTVADLSREISAALDHAEETGGEFAPGEYVLEVSSPGVDRPLTQPRHWRRNIGRRVAVSAGDRQLAGRVVAADEAGIVLEVAGQRHEFGYAKLGPGRVQVEFERLTEIADEDLADFGEDHEEEDEE
jgi:ribosome maturation factor RimP